MNTSIMICTFSGTITREILTKLSRCPTIFLPVSVFCRKYSLMDVKIRSSYEEAVYALNGLQSNAAYLRDSKITRFKDPSYCLKKTRKHLYSLGIKEEDLDDLNIIHVSGTKGKGSTCAFSESILRHHGVKTGFYSSPHLVSVNERIRINGQPLNQKQFAYYFWEAYNSIQKNLDKDEDMPTYFMFLTLLAYHVFLKEKVNAAIIEVGIGGLYDCTNIIKMPIVVGVTTLGLDHVSLLGNTLDLIAKQKAGIFKQGVPAFTAPQSDIAFSVLMKEAADKGCSLAVAPPLSSNEQNSNFIPLGISKSVQYINAGLAVQLTNEWLRRKKYSCLPKYYDFPLQSVINLERGSETALIENLSNVSVSSPKQIPVSPLLNLDETFCKGLVYCKWPGRFYIAKNERFTFYLDGAHTEESIQHCAHWFQEVSSKECSNIKSSVSRVLIFNCTGKRNPEDLLMVLTKFYFDVVIFTPNCVSLVKDASSDHCNLQVDPAGELQVCKESKDVWCHILNESCKTSAISRSSSSDIFEKSIHENVLQFSSLGNTISWLMKKPGLTSHHSSCSENDEFHRLLDRSHHIQVLVTGSLHLVGNVLSIIDPEFTGKVV